MLDLKIINGTIVDGTGRSSYHGSIGVRNGLIVEIGEVDGAAKRVIDAESMIVTPGFVDIHTHYDGQATWDPLLDPSFGSGVTTAILGNCGVGFAPVRHGGEQRLIELMEGVEEIPGTALHLGMKWNWESFPQYLDALNALPHSFDIGALMPHGPLRLYVMGDKVGSDKKASDVELAEMERLLDEAMRAGAFGLSSSRTPVHRTSLGHMTPDFDVDAPELTVLARRVARHGGYFGFAPNGNVGEDFAGLQSDMRLFRRIIDETGVTVHLLVSQTATYPDYWREQLRWAEEVNASGVRQAYLQVSGRSIAAALSFYGTHPFMYRPSFLSIKALPCEQWAAELARPAVKAAILAEAESDRGHIVAEMLCAQWNRMYDLAPDFGDYEPDDSRSVQSIADTVGCSPQEVAYDLLLRGVMQPQMLFAGLNYAGGNYDDLREMLTSPNAVLSSSDAGAHVMTVCDGSLHSFMLTHWARDRKRGARLPVEQVVRMMTLDSASAVGLKDRGVIAPGMKADLNIINLDRLRLKSPEFIHDLPGGAARLIQRVTGHKATIVSGVITREDDVATGAFPGRLVRKMSCAVA